LKTYDLRHYFPFEHPFYISIYSDAILTNLENLPDFTEEPTTGEHPPISIRGITRAFGVSIECHDTVFHGPQLRVEFWKDMTSFILCNVVEQIGNLQSLTVVHPQCLIGLGICVSAGLQKRKIKWEQQQKSNSHNDDPWTIPTMTFQACDCSFERQQAESQLRTLMAQQM